MTNRLFTRIAAVVASGALMLTAAACGSSTSSQSPSQDLTVVRSLETTNLFPATSFSNGDIWVIEQIYGTLTKNKPDGSGVEPGLASSWTQSADKKTWTFNLRKGVKFHNGSPVTAKDVKFSLDFARAPRDDKPFSFLLESIASVDAVDNDTVRVKVKQPWAPLPSDLAVFTASIMPANFGGKSEKTFAQHPVGTGPFKLQTWTKGDSVKLVKNPTYWDRGKPILNSVTFKYVPDDNTRAQMVESGQAQIDEFPPSSSVASLKNVSGVQVKSFPSTSLIWVDLNNKKKPLNDVHVRRALAYATDKNSIVKTVFYGQAKTANSFLSSSLMGYDKGIQDLPYDMAKAKAELKKSSVPNGFDVTMQVQSGVQERAQIAQILQASWKQLGVNVKLQTIDSSTIYSNRTAGDFEIQIHQMTNDIVDPDEWIRYMVYKGANVNTGFNDATVNALADRAATNDNVSERKLYYGKIQQIVTEQAPMIPLAYTPGLFLVRDNVQGFHVSILGEYGLDQTKLG